VAGDGVPDIRTFAVLSPFVGGDYYGAVIAGVNRAAVAAGHRVIAIQTLDPGSPSADISGVPDFRRPIAWRHLDGVVVMPGAIHPGYARALTDAGIAVVLIGHELAGVECPVVVADNRGGVRESVHHLVGHGHERIAFGGDLSHFDVRERHEGYRAGLLDNGIDPDPALLITAPDNHETGGVTIAEKLMAAGMPATAIVLGTDRNAIGLIRALTGAGHETPGELAVIGFDDIADARFLRPSLSTVNQPLDRLGRLAYELLAARQGPPRAATHTAPAVFVARDSCGCPPTGLRPSEDQVRAQFRDTAYLQKTLDIQYELSIELLGGHGRDPLGLAWLGRTPALGGCLGLWRQVDQPTRTIGTVAEPAVEIVGVYNAAAPAQAPADPVIRVGEFPPADLFPLADGAAGQIVFVVPVRSEAHDWGVLAAVGRIQDTTPPGREMMNHSGALLALALDHDALLRSLHEREEELRQAALHDHLTGLPNRALFTERLRQAWQRSIAEPDHRFALLYLDLDGFKQVNDTLGHATGDRLLVHVGQRLCDLLRDGDTAARLGGDEFVILLDGVDLPLGPGHVSDRIRAGFGEPVILDGHEIQVGVSIGVAMSTDGVAAPEDLLRHADAAMYAAKMRRKATRAAPAVHG
jgi:diguanylate cyclase (GGDEF)-like protein